MIINNKNKKDKEVNSNKEAQREIAGVEFAKENIFIENNDLDNKKNTKYSKKEIDHNNE